MKKILLAVAIITIILTGCKKKDSNTITTARTYYPLTAGTVHYYKRTAQDGSFLENVSDTITSKDTLINGINYRIIFENFTGFVNQSFMRSSNGSFFARVGSMFEESVGSDQDLLFIKEDVASGATWTGNVSNAWGNRICEVVETNLAVTLNGVTFNNVCVTHLYWEGHPTPFTTAYHAKGVGLIKTVSEMGETMEITSYSVK